MSVKTPWRGSVVWALAATFGVTSGCESSVDRSLEGLQCGAEQRCAVGYECRAGICVRPRAKDAERGKEQTTSRENASTTPSARSSDGGEVDSETVIAVHSGARTDVSTADVGDTSPPLTSDAHKAQTSGPHEVSSAPETQAESTHSSTNGHSSANGVAHEVSSEPSEMNDSTCGAACLEGRTCDGEGCTAECTSGKTSCAGRCVDTASDAEHCGRCNQACIAPPNATTRCEAARCEIVCYIGFEACQGLCVDTKSDSSNCGGCGLACKGNRVCVAGECTK